MRGDRFCFLAWDPAVENGGDFTESEASLAHFRSVVDGKAEGDQKFGELHKETGGRFVQVVQSDAQALRVVVFQYVVGAFCPTEAEAAKGDEHVSAGQETAFFFGVSGVRNISRHIVICAGRSVGIGGFSFRQVRPDR